MKIPVNPPNFKEGILSDKKLLNHLMKLNKIIQATTDKGEYLHWDKLKHLSPPMDLSSEQWWFALKIARLSLYKQLPFKDQNNNFFVLATPDVVLQKLHFIDRQSGNSLQSSALIDNQMRDTYVIQSLIEESITSSQLEGASTTRKVAKEMLRAKRKPRNTGEKMIYNNYQAMRFVQEIKNEKLNMEIILELHRILTKDTLEENLVGKFRTSNDVHVWDNTDQILHTPPDYKELNERINKLCEFANKNEDELFFIHPVIKAIIIHFMFGYDHPFADGNGRTARALFYWSMAYQGYWLMEFISISQIIKRAPIKYARAFLYTETDDNDTTYFVIQQLEVILKAIQELHEFIKVQSRRTTEIEQLIHKNRTLQDKLNYRQIALIMHALKHPNTRYMIEAHRQSHNITYDTARTDLLKLADLQLLDKQKSSKAFIFTVPTNLKELIEDIK